MRLSGLPRTPTRTDVAVVGHGIPALAVALELAHRGTRVTVVGDAADSLPTAPLGLALLGPGRPYLDVAQAIGRPAAQLLWAAGCENHLRLKAFLDQAARPCSYVVRGSFLLARSRPEAEALAESEDMLRDDGFRGEFLDHYMLEARFDLAGFPAAYWAAEDAELDARELVSLLALAAREAGVVFLEGRALGVRRDAASVVVELERGSVRAPAGVVASEGPAAALLPELAPLLRPATTARVSLAPLAGARLPGAVRTCGARLAWQGSEGGFELAETVPEGTRELAELAARQPFELGGARVEETAAELPLDGLPVVGRLPGEPLAVACGFALLSPGLAFGAARWVADALLRGTDPTPEPLRPTRQPLAGLV